MPRQRGTEFMMSFVQDYLDDNMDRMSFDLDFNHYLIKHYPSMERKNSDLAECFSFYLAEEGFDEAISLSDAEHKKLICNQWQKFQDAMRDGFC